MTTLTERPADERAPSATIDVENPATGEVIATIPDMGEAEIAALAARARAAQPAWEELGFKARAQLMRSLRGWLVRNRESIIDTVEGLIE